MAGMTENRLRAFEIDDVTCDKSNLLKHFAGGMTASLIVDPERVCVYAQKENSSLKQRSLLSIISL
jgi:hypothetical protein